MSCAGNTAADMFQRHHLLGILTLYMLTCSNAVDAQSQQIGESADPVVFQQTPPISSTTTVPEALATTISNIVLVATNNGPLVFDSNQYTGSIPAGSPAGTLVLDMNILVTDTDQIPENNQFTLTLSAFNDVFSISPNSGPGSVSAAIVVFNSSKLNYDTGPRQYLFYVTANAVRTNGQQLSASVMVTISVLGGNNYAPVFSPTLYNTSISELAPPGTLLISLNATDSDYGVFGYKSVWYRFERKNYIGSYLFRCGKWTGQITVGPCSTPGRLSCIDYERTPSYTLVVLAVDSYGEGFTATATINVLIINENDNELGNNEFDEM